MASRPSSSHSVSGGFRRVVSAFISQPGLPFAAVLSGERIERIFQRHRNLFATRGVYTTANIL